MSDIDELPPPSSEPADEENISPHSLLDDYMSNPAAPEEEIPPPPYTQDDVVEPPQSEPPVTTGLIDLDLDPLTTQPEQSMASPPAPIDLLDPIPVNNSTGAEGQVSPTSPMDFDPLPPANSCGAEDSIPTQGDPIGLDLDPIPITNSIGTDAMSPNECKVDLHPIPPGNDMGPVDLSPLNDPIEPDLIVPAVGSEAEAPQTTDQMDIEPPPLTQNDQTAGKASSPGYDANFDPIPVTHISNKGASTTGNDHIERDPIPAASQEKQHITPAAEAKDEYAGGFEKAIEKQADMKVIEQNLSSPETGEDTKIIAKNKPGFKSDEYYKAPFLQSYSEDQIHEAGKPEKLPSPTSLQRQDALDEQNKSPKKDEKMENVKSDFSQPKQNIHHAKEDSSNTKNAKNTNLRSADVGFPNTQQAAQHMQHDNARKQEYRKSKEMKEKAPPLEEKDDLIETYEAEKYDLGHDAMEAQEECIGYKDRDDSTDALLAKDYTQKSFPTSGSAGFAHINSLGRIKIMPAHRHKCVLCGCSRCCCVRECVWGWITFFILVMLGCIAVLTLDGVYSLQYGHTFARYKFTD